MENLKFLTKKDVSLKQLNWAEVISTATKKEENLLQKNAEELTELMDQGRGIVAVSNCDDIVGFVALWSLGIDRSGIEWNEIGTVYVMDQYRNRGVCQQMLSHAFALWHDHMIISTSKNEKFIHASLKSMVSVTAGRSVDNVVPLTCVCTREDGVEDAENCPYRDAECVFLLSYSTAQRVSYQERGDAIIKRIIEFFK
jgi:hypothetical protein